MIVTEDEFIAVIEIDRQTLASWVESGWLVPRDQPPVRSFTEVEVARGRLIADLIGPMGVNAEGVDIVLDLLDQLHGLRTAMQRLGRAIEAQPEEDRHRFHDVLRPHRPLQRL